MGKQQEREIAKCNAFLTKTFSLSICLYCSDISVAYPFLAAELYFQSFLGALFIIVLFSFFSPCLLSIPFLWTGVQSMPWKSIVSLWGELIISFSWICSLMFFLTSYSYFNCSTHAIFRCECCFSTVIVSLENKQRKDILIQNADQKF